MSRESEVSLIRKPVPPELDFVLADRQRLLQVFLNLLSNGIKYNRRAGSLTISVEAADEGYTRVLFADTGEGIPPEHLNRLFQPFERFSTSQTEGTGLGLVLAQKFLNVMGGNLHLVRTSKEGSCFEAILEKASPSGPGPESTAHPDQLFSSLHGVILYIEDNLSNLKLLQMLLEGYPAVSLLPAMQGHVGLDLAQVHKPDLILLDLHLPDISGLDVLWRLKQNEETARIPVVVISADATKGQIERLKEAGASDYLTKPLHLETFLSVVSSHLENVE
jgi:CheY-like chemotaxis protein